MKVYEALTLGEFIELLDSLQGALVRGFDGQVHSYRGYYERNATTPSEDVTAADVLAASYRSEVGKEMFGWKGGYYTCKAEEWLYYTQPGDTGAAVAALELAEDGSYEPVGVSAEWW